MFEYFYNEIFRSVIIGFGSLFNGIQVQKKDDKDDTFSVIKVPLAYGPTQKFLARMQQSPDLNHPVQMTLPRMSFEFTALAYDPTRKSTQTQQIVITKPDGGEEKKTFLPVPYNMTIVLSNDVHCFDFISEHIKLYSVKFVCDGSNVFADSENVTLRSCNNLLFCLIAQSSLRSAKHRRTPLKSLDAT